MKLRMSIRKFARLAEASMELVRARLVVTVGRGSFWQRSLGVRTDVASTAPAVPDDDTPRLVGNAVRSAARRLPGDFVCLPQAMAASRMMARRRVPSLTLIGAKRDASAGPLDLHAWVLVNERRVTGGKESDRFIPMLAFERSVTETRTA